VKCTLLKRSEVHVQLQTADFWMQNCHFCFQPPMGVQGQRMLFILGSLESM